MTPKILGHCFWLIIYVNKVVFCSRFTTIVQCTKNHIYQVLEYNEKLKNTKKISTFHQLFRSKKTVFPISEKFKTRSFPYSKNMVFHAEENIILHQLFESKENHISHLRKFQNNSFSVFRKHGTPCWRKYNLTSTFRIKRKPHFPSSKSSKHELFLSCKIHVFVIISFFLSQKLMFLLTILKTLIFIIKWNMKPN